MAADPRECGGNPPVTRRNIAGKGPSPRVRGKRSGRSLRERDVRSIPASAGETRGRHRSRRIRPVHPRECGGNTVPSSRSRREAGPSPRVRGKHLAARPLTRWEGSIPASAGETSVRCPRSCSIRVHPRECGGNAYRNACSGNGMGPSPRVRGKQNARPKMKTLSGSIPASAGETSAARPNASKPGVHPRECGGNAPRSCRPENGSGPSPRVRGKPWGEPRPPRRTGSIPASAGETVRECQPPRWGEVHPRECGGNRVDGPGRGRGEGPSPRVRGKHPR